ncbi:uncharacterized protein [Battus philenor]|uniref:uncharacterized protein n=1 Tax=Battus philenor TaxID=42288 RepID=UPI0035CFC578
MTVLKPIKHILLIGNFLALFRNISFCNSKLRVVIMILFAIVEISLTILNCVIIAYYHFYNNFADILQRYIILFNSVLFITFSCYYSNILKKLMISFEKNSSMFVEDSLYLKKIKMFERVTIFIFMLFVALKVVYIGLNTMYYHKVEEGLPIFIILFIQLNSSLSNIRFFYEYCLMCTLLFVIADQLECIVRSMEKDINLVNGTYEMVETNNTNVIQDKIGRTAQWSKMYCCVAGETDIFNTIFSLQIFIMLITAILYMSIFLYAFTFLSVSGFKNTPILINYALNIIITHIQILVLSKSAQRIKNNVKKIRCCLGRLLIISLQNHNWYRATMDLLRFISKGQLRIQAFGSFIVDMSLPPTCILLFTSYTVIALQFNNVL